MPQICSLKDKTCKPCEGDDTLKFDNNQIKDHLKQVKNWKIKKDKLYKEFKFKNFLESLKFVNEVGKVAELEQHHPDLAFGWGYCNITLYTHALNGLSENDFIVAAKIDQIS